MQFKFLQSICELSDNRKIVALCWSPNNKKLAVATSDRQIILFDDSGEKRDKFSTKPSNSEQGKKSYVIKAISFSPDSTKLAVAQSDNFIFVYKLGDDWGQKKAICNKFSQSSAVLAMCWLQTGPIICGLLDGKVRALQVKSNSSHSLYTADSAVISLCPNNDGTGFLSGHVDGSVIRCYVVDRDDNAPTGKVLSHAVPPFALAWTQHHDIFAGGCDRRIVVYNRLGKTTKQFDYNRTVDDEHEFTVACCSPSGQAVLVGSFNKLRIFAWNSKMSIWEESSTPTELNNVYSVTSLSWRGDGSKIACGTLSGNVLLFESVLKRSVWKDKLEITYVGPSQLIIKPLSSNFDDSVVLKSQMGQEIEEIKIMGKDNYCVARTKNTLLIADLFKNSVSEVPWNNANRSEKFYFENSGVCLVFNSGELSLVEYGNNTILSSVRTEFANPHLISVRLNERTSQGPRLVDNKKLAYLVDLKTICIVDLANGKTISQINHESKIDWLELNETCRKLLFRDIKQRLMVIDVNTDTKTCIFSGVTFVQWVENSDVAIAQSANSLAIWYNIDLPERPTITTVKGEVYDIVRESGKTEILTLDGNITNSFTLDEGLLEFGTAIHDHDYGKAVLFLELIQSAAPEAEAMWYNLLSIAQQEQNFNLMIRCYAAVGKNARVFCAQEILEKFDGDPSEEEQLTKQEVMAKMAVLNGDLETAKNYYLERHDLDMIIQLYKSLHKTAEAISLAEKMGYEHVEELKTDHMKSLLAMGQYERAGQVLENAGEAEKALTMYLRANRLLKAVGVLFSNGGQMLTSDTGLVSNVLRRLVRQEQYEPAAEIYSKINKPDLALECFEKGKHWNRAVELARVISADRVTDLEENWGDHLCEHKQYDAAISHYIEAGATLKALDAAVAARQWKKALHIVEVVADNDQPAAAKYYGIIAQHLATIKDYRKAESMYIRGGLFSEAVTMYNEAGQWERAHLIAAEHLDEETVREMYLKQGDVLEKSGKYREAEKLYVAVNAPDVAITMYKKIEQYDNMIRLVEQYHPDLLQTTHLHLAQQMESQGKCRAAEIHYLAVNEWKAAMNMYRNLNIWEEAYRVAKQNGGAAAGNQVAFLWARTLPIESAIKLLTKFGILESSIDYASETYQYEFAFQLCKNLPTKNKEVHYSYALALEDDGKYPAAELEFIAADRAREAVLMYTHAADWPSALRIASAHAPQALPEVLRAQAMARFTESAFAEFEALLLRAQQPELIVQKYKTASMWPDALRVCKEYLPQHLQVLQEEYNNSVVGKSGNGQSGGGDNTQTMQTLLTRANELVVAGLHRQAIECLLQVNESIAEKSIVRRALLRACDMTTKFLYEAEATDMYSVIAPRLREIGEFNAAGQIYGNIGEFRLAIDSFIDGDDWKAAGTVAKECEDATLKSYIEDRYKQKLTKEENVEQLADVDIISALDLLVQQKQWTRCLDKARQTNNPATLHKYVGLYAAQLLRDGFAQEALHLYIVHGTPALPQNFGIYDQIANSVFAGIAKDNNEEYNTWKELRQMLYELVTGLKNAQNIEVKTKMHFNTLLLISHYLGIRAICRQVDLLKGLAVRISVALLRYTDIIPADKAFYEAGLDLIEEGKLSEAFIFLNHYLDICEAIEDEDNQLIDHTELTQTDFPSNIPVPEQMFLRDNPEEHNRIREWVLTISMDQKVEQYLRVDDRQLFESSLQPGMLPCLISGYPVNKPETAVTFSQSSFSANKDYWNKLNMAEKMHPDTELRDVLNFIKQWCGTTVSH